MHGRPIFFVLPGTITLIYDYDDYDYETRRYNRSINNSKWQLMKCCQIYLYMDILYYNQPVNHSLIHFIHRVLVCILIRRFRTIMVFRNEGCIIFRTFCMCFYGIAKLVCCWNTAAANLNIVTINVWKWSFDMASISVLQPWDTPLPGWRCQCFIIQAVRYNIATGDLRQVVNPRARLRPGSSLHYEKPRTRLQSHGTPYLCTVNRWRTKKS